MSGPLVHSEAAGLSIPAGEAVEAAANWEAVEAEVAEALTPLVERQAKEVADRIYGELLETTQEYLAQNIRWNIASRLEAAERGRRAEWERAEAAVKRAQLFEDFTRRIARLITGDEWVAQGRKFSADEAVVAINREILNARAAIAKAKAQPPSQGAGE